MVFPSQELALEQFPKADSIMQKYGVLPKCLWHGTTVTCNVQVLSLMILVWLISFFQTGFHCVAWLCRTPQTRQAHPEIHLPASASREWSARLKGVPSQLLNFLDF